MLPAFNMLAASVLALAWLTIGLLFPILAVWFCVRVARDLRRIAEAQEESARLLLGAPRLRALPEQHPKGIVDARVYNSMFGR